MRAICNAAHSNEPISAKISEIKMIATNAKVAYHTILVTSITSLKSTTPMIKAISAPPHADQPSDNAFGCQMTKMSVNRKMSDASIIDDDKINSSNQLH